jgi:hypothetical protein
MDMTTVHHDFSAGPANLAVEGVRWDGDYYKIDQHGIVEKVRSLKPGKAGSNLNSVTNLLYNIGQIISSLGI